MEQQQPGQFFLVSGNDEARIAEEASRIFKTVAGENPDPLACDVFTEDESGPTPELLYNVINSIQSPSFLGGCKTVWLKHYSGFPKEKDPDKKRTNKDAVALRTLADFLAGGLPPNTICIIDGPAIDQHKYFFKKCRDSAKVILLTKPDMAQRDWQNAMLTCIRNGAALKKVRLSSQAEDYLLDVLGTDTARIGPELEKVICYRGGTNGTISVDEIQQVCNGKGEEMSWTLGKMLGKRDIGEALRVIDVLIAQNKADDNYARALIYSASNFFRQIIRVKLLMALTHAKTPVTLRMKINAMTPADKKKLAERGLDVVNFNPFRLQNLAAESEKFTPHEIINALRVIRDASWQSMSSATTPRIALESALLEILGTQRTQTRMNTYHHTGIL